MLPVNRRTYGEYLETGEVCRVLSVAPLTVHRMFDAGVLTGYRVKGVAKHARRRISRASVIAYLRDRGMRLPAGFVSNIVAVVGCDKKISFVI